MNKNWTVCIIASIICRFLALAAILAFVYFMVVFSGSLHCLWLLFLLFAVDLVPTYEFKREVPMNKENNDGKSN
jgi:putative effector of murein hydrolase LrgA (UPF0299 family)